MPLQQARFATGNVTGSLGHQDSLRTGGGLSNWPANCWLFANSHKSASATASEVVNVIWPRGMIFRIPNASKVTTGGIVQGNVKPLDIGGLALFAEKTLRKCRTCFKFATNGPQYRGEYGWGWGDRQDCDDCTPSAGLQAPDRLPVGSRGLGANTAQLRCIGSQLEHA
jgi:hypothetical protein